MIWAGTQIKDADDSENNKSSEVDDQKAALRDRPDMSGDKGSEQDALEIVPE